MKFYFQRPPKDASFRVEYLENPTEQAITFKLFRRAKEEGNADVLLDERSFEVADIFVKDFYALLPIRDEKFMEPINMEEYCGQVGATEQIQKVYQYDSYACYIIFGSDPVKEKLSLLGLLDFGKKGDQVRNANEYMDFYRIVELSVDDPKKIKFDAQKRAIISTISTNEVLTGLEAQLDVVSKMFLALIREVEDLKGLPLDNLDGVDVRIFSELLRQTSVLNVKSIPSALDEMKVQKEKVRKEQERYFIERSRIQKNLS